MLDFGNMQNEILQQITLQSGLVGETLTCMTSLEWVFPANVLANVLTKVTKIYIPWAHTGPALQQQMEN